MILDNFLIGRHTQYLSTSIYVCEVLFLLQKTPVYQQLERMFSALRSEEESEIRGRPYREQINMSK